MTRSPARILTASALTGLLLVGGAVALPVRDAHAQSSAGTAASFNTGNPKRDTLLRMMRPITVEFTDQRLEDIMTFLKDITGADLNVAWSDAVGDGLDKETLVSLKAENDTALNVLERVLEKADFASGFGGFGGGSTWQLTDWGAMEVAPRDILNRRKRVEIYDIADMLVIIPSYEQAPQLDLQQVLSSSQGGGGQSPFRDDQQDREEQIPRDERAQDIIDVIISLVEPDQWQDNGGDGGSIRYFQGSLIVNAPDYMHRELAGYSFWPQRSTQTRQRADAGDPTATRRYVSFTMDTGFADVVDFANQPVTAVVGGQLVPSGGGG